MSDTNVWVLIGRLTKDAEGKSLPSGTFVSNFSIANETGWGDKKRTNFWKVRYFGQGATAIHEYLTKGKQVSIQGEGSIDSYVNGAGIEVKETIITAQKVQLLASPAGGAQQAGGARNPKFSHGEYGENVEDEIPY